MSTTIIDRREFLQRAGALAAATVATGCIAPIAPAQPGAPRTLPKRALGKTGVQLSVVGFGGIVVDQVTPAEASQLVAQAIDRGINYFDVAPSYGMAEQRLGPALEPYRSGVFLACKTNKRDKEGAARELERSLEYLRTDHFDLYQFHGVTALAEVERIMGPGGALETFLAARDQGVIRHIGFSAHSVEAALALLERFTFDTILFPVNWVCWHRGNFGPQVVETAQAQGLGILALKALAKGPRQAGAPVKWPKCWYAAADNPAEAATGLRFTLSRPVTAAVSPSHAELLWWACDAAAQFTPLSEAEEAQLVQASAALEPLFTA